MIEAEPGQKLDVGIFPVKKIKWALINVVFANRAGAGRILRGGRRLPLEQMIHESQVEGVGVGQPGTIKRDREDRLKARWWRRCFSHHVRLPNTLSRIPEIGGGSSWRAGFPAGGQRV